VSDYLHIVCLDAPSPPTYGGAIDMYYKITSLAGLGKKIILHYFDYSKKRDADSLDKYCEEINAYERKGFFTSLSFSTPYIIRSRTNRHLINRLNEDNHPILLEGLHCTGVLPFINNRERVVIRMHNEEVNYYKSLAALEGNFFKKIYFSLEVALLEKFQKRLNKKIQIACLSEKDIDVLRKEYGFINLHFVPCFIPWQSVRSLEGKGNYCLYHGNMAVSENEAAAIWLVKNVFSKINIPFVISGNKISKNLTAIAKEFKNCKLIYNPPADELRGLIKDAHINLLPSKNNTGVKLKLLHALFEGRFCITNSKGIEGSQIKSGLRIANEPGEYIQLVKELFEQDFTSQHIAERQMIEAVYNNENNALKLSELW
jgi:hypothetical protein